MRGNVEELVKEKKKETLNVLTWIESKAKNSFPGLIEAREKINSSDPSSSCLLLLQ